MREPFANSSPILVGRETEWKVLSTLSQRARTGSGIAVLITGEPGVGKTRLADEMVKRLRDGGDLILSGACHESQQATVFAPWRDILQDLALVEPARQVAGWLKPVANEIRVIAPELAAHLPPVEAESVADQRVLFHALLSLFETISRELTLVLRIEDIHWADEVSLECLRYLTARVSQVPVFLLMTARPDGSSPAFEQILGHSVPSGHMETVTLQPLNADGISRMLGAMFGLQHDVGPVFAHRLHEFTGGVPLFVEEAVASLLADGAIHRDSAGNWRRRAMDQLPVPASIHEAMQPRLLSLGHTSRVVLQAAAVIGQEVDFDLLINVTGFAEPDLIVALRELVDARLLVESLPDRFEFHHVLTREAVAATLLARERREWHLKTALAFLSRDSSERELHLEATVYHLVAAGEWEESLPLAIRAGVRALNLGAPYASIQHLGHAEQAAMAMNQDLPGEVFLTRGRAYAMVGEFNLALADYSHLFDLARESGDQQLEAEANFEIGGLWSGRDYIIAGTHIRESLRLARTLEDQTLLGRCLNMLGNWHTNQDEPHRALVYHQEALELARERHDHPGEAATWDLVAMASSIGDDLLAAADSARQSLAMFERLGDRRGIAGSVGLVFVNALVECQTLVGTGALSEAQARVERALEISEELDWEEGRAYFLGVLGQVRIFAGDLGRGIAMVTDAYDIATRIDHREWRAQALLLKATALCEMGDIDDAVTAVEEAYVIARELRSTLWWRAVSAIHARVMVQSGDIDRATEFLAAAGEPPMTTSNSRLFWLARAELLIAQQQPAEAVAVIDRLYSTARHLRREGDIPALALAKADALFAMDQPRDALTLLESSLLVLRDQGARLGEVKALALMARLHVAANDREAGNAARDDAHRLSERIAATLPPGLDRERYLRRTRLALDDPLEEATPGASPNPGGLTAREHEVALLVTEGLSNREIAERLYLGERTIETHVSNTLRKLGVTSRTQIATWMVENT